jgi:hypothetical protein
MDGSDLTVVSATLLLHAAKPAVKRFLVRPPKPLAEQLHELFVTFTRSLASSILNARKVLRALRHCLAKVKLG